MKSLPTFTFRQVVITWEEIQAMPCREVPPKARLPGLKLALRQERESKKGRWKSPGKPLTCHGFQ